MGCVVVMFLAILTSYLIGFNIGAGGLPFDRGEWIAGAGIGIVYAGLMTFLLWCLSRLI